MGVLDYKENLEGIQRLRLVKALGTAAEIRGTDATGIAFFQRGRLCIQKAADEDAKVIPIAQRSALLKAAEADPIMCPVITMLMFTGMRIGELLALQWKHIDFQAKTITIRRR